jgi:hypothetical protein
VLYIALDKINDFWVEPADRLYQPVLLDKIVDVLPYLTRIAVPEILLPEADALPETFNRYFRLAVIFIAVDTPRELEDDVTKVQGWWEFNSTQGRAFVWNYDQGSFNWADGEHIGDESLYRRIEEASNGLGEVFSKNLIRGCEIRPGPCLEEMSELCMPSPDDVRL